MLDSVRQQPIASPRCVAHLDDLGEISRNAELFLRDRLNAVLGFSALLREEKGLTQRQRRYAQHIEIAGEAILRQLVSSKPDYLSGRATISKLHGIRGSTTIEG